MCHSRMNNKISEARLEITKNLIHLFLNSRHTKMLQINPTIKFCYLINTTYNDDYKSLNARFIF